MKIFVQIFEIKTIPLEIPLIFMLDWRQEAKDFFSLQKIMTFPPAQT